MMTSHMNKIAILFGYEDYRQAPWASTKYEHVKTMIGVLKSQKLAHTTINAILSAVRGTVKAAMGMQMMCADDYQRDMLVEMVSECRLPTGRMMTTGEIKALVLVATGSAVINLYPALETLLAKIQQGPRGQVDCAVRKQGVGWFHLMFSVRMAHPTTPLRLIYG